MTRRPALASSALATRPASPAPTTMTSPSPLIRKVLALVSPIVQDRIGRCAAGGREMALKGQAAIVTGAGQGIGKAIATRLAQEGADIGIIDLNGEKAQATSEELRRMGRRAVVSVA